MALRNLTIGNSDFERMRLNDRIYVDKTQLVPMLRSKGEFYFFSRPRRFGKTMFLGMLKAYFQGKRELFKDLALDRYSHWDVYPILHFDMSDIGEDYELSETNGYLKTRLHEIAQNYGITLANEIKPREMFRQLLLRCHEKYQKKQ